MKLVQTGSNVLARFFFNICMKLVPGYSTVLARYFNYIFLLAYAEYGFSQMNHVCNARSTFVKSQRGSQYIYIHVYNHFLDYFLLQLSIPKLKIIYNLANVLDFLALYGEPLQSSVTLQQKIYLLPTSFGSGFTWPNNPIQYSHRMWSLLDTNLRQLCNLTHNFGGFLLCTHYQRCIFICYRI